MVVKSQRMALEAMSDIQLKRVFKHTGNKSTRMMAYAIRLERRRAR